MPLDKKDIEKVFDLKCKYFLKKMERGKFYSYTEMKSLILENSLHRPQVKEMPEESRILLDLAYVEAVIQAQYAVGNLRCGEKNGNRYYSKVFE